MYTFRPAIRENTPLIIGIAGPTKSGKTYSALRLAIGLANGGTIAMINAEGLRGHQYAESFKYITCDLSPPFRPDTYSDALVAAAALKPAVIIIDSASHMHDGPGGILEWHEEILDQMAGQDRGKRDKCTFTAWVKPKSSENHFIYTMLGMKCPVILCMRAKEKIKIITGKPPIDLGWQPIVGDRVGFETIFTLMLTPHCGGIPDLSLSDMREPFDTMIPKDQPLSEQTGAKLAQWANGGTMNAAPAPSQPVKEPIREAKPVIPRKDESPSTIEPPTGSHLNLDKDIEQQDLANEYKAKFAQCYGMEANPLYKELMADTRVTKETRDRLYKDYTDALQAKRVLA